MERWLQVNGFPKYSVSNQGRVRNDDSGRIMAQVVNQAGVVTVYLVRDGRQFNRGVAKLVATHFLPHHSDHIFNTPMHLDGDRTNNAVENLIWRPRWYAFKYQQQFEDYRPPFVDRPLIEGETGRVFENSWHAATELGLLEKSIAHSYHAFQGHGELVPAFPTNYHFRLHE